MKYFTPAEDVIGKEKDGRTFVIAHGGTPIPYVQAERMGLTDGQVTEIEVAGESDGPGIRARKPVAAPVVAQRRQPAKQKQKPDQKPAVEETKKPEGEETQEGAGPQA